MNNHNYKQKRNMNNKYKNTYKNIKSKSSQNKDRQKQIFKQIFIEIPDIYKNQKKIRHYLHDTRFYDKVITQYGEYKINTNDIVDITQIPLECYKKILSNKYNDVDMFVNVFENNKQKTISQIPLQSKIVHVREKQYKMDKHSNLTLIIEESIVLNNEIDNYDMNFEDKDNDIIRNYYFTILNEDEDSTFVKEDIFAFLNYLN